MSLARWSVVLVALVLVAAACGDSDSPDDTQTATSEAEDSGSSSAPATTAAEPVATTEAATEADGAYPRTVSHVQGETEIPEPPSRIVAATSFAELDTLLGLGVEVAVRGSYGEELARSKVDAGAGELEVWEISWPPSVEAVAELEPDIVFVSFGDGNAAEFYDPVAAVAPTFVLPAGDLEEQVRIVAEALNLPQERVDGALADVNASLDSFAPARTPESVMMIDYYCGESVWFWVPESGPGRTLNRLGLSLTELEGGEPGAEAFEISLENLDLLDADLLLMSTYSEAEANLEEGCVVDLYENPAFQALPVFQEGNVAVLTPEEGRSLDTSSILNVETFVRGMERALAG
ncbi:MAG: ABC transporter substrate-binding protein [Actinomycetota bacterium]